MKATNNKIQQSMCHERANAHMDEQMNMASLQIDNKQQAYPREM
jgi:hypothetical protein